MFEGDDLLSDLLEALTASPDNVTLRGRVGDMLLKRGRLDEATALYREGVRLAPSSERLKLGLARCFFQNGNDSEAHVIAESLLERPAVRAAAHLLLCRLHLRAGAFDAAARAYRRAVDLDAKLASDELCEALGLEDDAAPDDDLDHTPDDVDDQGRLLARSVRHDRPAEFAEMERPALTFADVGGMDDLKEQIRMKIIHPATHAEIYAAYGKAAGGGVLFYGPPGCGKTYLARATAGEVEAGFIVVGINDILDMYIGQSEQRLHAIFEQARSNAPCVLFFDEVDALGASRSDMRQSGGRHMINQFLAELDGAQSSNEGVLILGATNAPWHLDPAFRRPGRFDQIVFVPPPDVQGRAAILRVLLQGKPVADVDHAAIAKKTKGFSGADLKAVIDQAIEAKLAEAMRKGAPSPLTTKDLLGQTRRRKSTTTEWFSTARNYAMFANEGGAYDDVLRYLESS